MADRSVEDHLREEYFELLPEIRHVLEYLEASIRHSVLPIVTSLKKFERVEVVSRVKACDSALDALRRRQEGKTFDQNLTGDYTLAELKDLAGVRILVFPRSRLTGVDANLREAFREWTYDPIRDDETNGEVIAPKYHGFCPASERVQGEYQVVPALVGLFWEVEHSAFYKLTPELKGGRRELEMAERKRDVYQALRAFETSFERLINERAQS